MKDIQTYIDMATRTESTIPNVVANKQALIDTLVLFVSVASILDQFKKHIYYGKPYNEALLVQHIKNTADGVNNLIKSGQKIISEEQAFDATQLNPRLFHAAVGMSTECGELINSLLLPLIDDNQKFDGVNFKEEMFDIDWYKFIAMDELNGDLESIWETGFKKLQARYPDKFEQDKAINRDIKTEREILDKGM